MSCNPSGGDINLFDCFILNPQEGTTVADVYDTPATLVNTIVTNIFLLAGVILFLMILFAGFKFAMSPQSKGKEDAAEIGKAAGIGFMIMFSAFWIVKIIELIIGTEILF